MDATGPAVDGILVRTYGTGGPKVCVMHGGPGAPGYMAPVCRALSDERSVLEPLQRTSIEVPLTVSRHVADLREVLAQTGLTGGVPATLIGHSWGAMLSLAFAAEHPAMVSTLVLVGCGTFDLESRRVFEAAVAARLKGAARQRLAHAERTIADPDARMCVVGRILERVYSVELEPHRDETEYYDAKGGAESWQDMLRLQRERVYPERFSHVTAPVLMLHGACDPHPGRAIHACLARFISRIEYVELPGCGHYPWWERQASGLFFQLLRHWLTLNSA